VKQWNAVQSGYDSMPAGADAHASVMQPRCCSAYAVCLSLSKRVLTLAGAWNRRLLPSRSCSDLPKRLSGKPRCQQAADAYRLPRSSPLHRTSLPSIWARTTNTSATGRAGLTVQGPFSFRSSTARRAMCRRCSSMTRSSGSSGAALWTGSKRMQVAGASKECTSNGTWSRSTICRTRSSLQ